MPFISYRYRHRYQYLIGANISSYFVHVVTGLIQVVLNSSFRIWYRYRYRCWYQLLPCPPRRRINTSSESYLLPVPVPVPVTVLIPVLTLSAIETGSTQAVLVISYRYRHWCWYPASPCPPCNWIRTSRASYLLPVPVLAPALISVFFLVHPAWSRCSYLHKRTFSFLPVFFPGYFSTSCVASLRLLLLAAGVLATKE